MADPSIVNFAMRLAGKNCRVHMKATYFSNKVTFAQSGQGKVFKKKIYDQRE